MDARELLLTLLRQRGKVEYLVLYRRVQRDQEDPCATLQLEEAVEWLEEDALDALSAEVSEDEIPEPIREALGVWAWLQSSAVGNADADVKETFRLRAMGPKGYAKVFGRTLTVLPEPADLDEVVRGSRPAPAPTGSPAGGWASFEFPPLANLGDCPPAVASFQHLGNQYNHFGQLVLGMFAAHAEISQRQMVQSSTELQAARTQVGELFTTILQHVLASRKTDVEESRAEIEAQTSAKTAEAVEKLVGEVGSTARFVLTAKNLSPKAQELLALLSEDPEVLDALQDPRVVELFKNDEKRKQLVIVLRTVAAGASESAPSAQDQAA